MASGYVLAAFLETTGLIGLVIAALKIRAERRAKAAELRDFLRSGQMPSASAASIGSHRAPGRRIAAVTVAPARSRNAEARQSSARSALSRAIAQSGTALRTEFGTRVSAG